MKIFCKKCKHRKPWEAGMGWCGYECKVNKTLKTTPHTQYYQLMDCDKINANNDCKKYEENWFYSFLSKIKNRKIDEPITDRSEILDIR